MANQKKIRVADINATGTANGTTYLRGDNTWSTVSGTGDVVGPASATDNALARYDGTTGKLIQDSVGTLDDSGILNVVSGIISGTNGAGHINLRHQASDATATGQTTSLFANSSGDIEWKNAGNFYTTLATSANTADRVYTFPDTSGTLFMLPSLTSGSVLFSNGTTVAQDNTNFFWDDTNNRLGIGTNAPSVPLHVQASTAGGHVLLDRITTATNSVAGAIIQRATSTGDMADGFGVQQAFQIMDTAGVANTIGVITSTRQNGSDGNGTFAILPYSAGVAQLGLYVNYTGNTSVGGINATGSRLDISTTRSSANTGNSGVNFTTRTGTFTDTSSSGTVALIHGHSFYSNTFAASSTTTYTDASNLYINGAPTAGTNVSFTNSYALWVDNGTTRLDGSVYLPSVTSSSILATTSGNIITALSTATYPSLTELSYVKGVTSAIQTQLDSKQSTITTGTTAQYLRGDLSLATFPTAVSAFTNDSGYITASSTTTLTNKRITRRVQSVASSATVTPSWDNDDDVIITALATGLTLANPTGTPTDCQQFVVRIKDNGTARTIAFGANYRAIGVTLPTTTTANKTIYIGCKYNSLDSKVDVTSVATEA